MLKNIKVLSSLAVASFLIGCGGGGTSGGNAITETTEVTIVDPYISGATVFWDKNNNGIMDSGEPESTLSDENGKAIITGIIPEGEILVMNTKGVHGGVDYTGTLKAMHNINGVISPLTTLEVVGFTKTEIVSLLGNSITEEDIIKNPMTTITSTTTSVTDEDINLIKANMAVNTFLNINGFDSTKDNLNTNSSDLDKSLNLMNILISSNNVTTTNNALNVVKAALAMNNYALSQNDARTAVSNLETDGNRDTYFSALLANLASNPDIDVKLGNDGIVQEVFTYTIDDLISDYTKKTSFAVEYAQIGNYLGTNFNTNYMNFIDGSDFYEYVDSREVKFPNDEYPTFKISSKKIDETHYGNYLNGELNDTCEVLSYKKVSDIIGISVDAIEVKTFCEYDENGLDAEWEEAYDANGTYSSIEDYKNYLIGKKYIGEESNSIESDGKVYDSSDNLIDGSSWVIENNILKIRFYDEIWYKIENGTVMELWKGDTQLSYIGVTKAQTDKITNKINPNIISASSGFKEGYLQNEAPMHSVYKNDSEWYLDSNLTFSNGKVYQNRNEIVGYTYTIENGMIKNDDNGDIWYDKILAINPNYLRMCSLEVGDTLCQEDMKYYIYFDEDSANDKLSELKGN